MKLSVSAFTVALYWFRWFYPRTRWQRVLIFGNASGIEVYHKGSSCKQKYCKQKNVYNNPVYNFNHNVGMAVWQDALFDIVRFLLP